MQKITKLGVALIFVLAATFAVMPTAHASPLKIPVFSSTSSTPDLLVPAVQGPSVTQRLSKRAESSWPWYITRASGLIAALSLIVLLISGIGLIGGYTFKFLEPLTAWATHRALGIVFAVSIVIHVVSLLFDHYVPFSVAQVLVPFLSHYRSVTIGGVHLGSIYVALGIIAGYATAAMVLTTRFWIDKKPHTWKAFHFLAYLIMLFVFIHALYLGTDLAHGVFRILWIALGCLVALAVIYRLRRAGSTWLR